MRRVPFDVVTKVIDHLDQLLVSGKMERGEWADAVFDTLHSLGWTDAEFEAEIDARWSPVNKNLS